MTAGLVLAVMIIPIVTAVSREVLATVAQDDKNAALAMGATRWEMLRVVRVPACAQRARRRGHARPGPRAGRDDRRRARDRRATRRSRRTSSSPATAWRRSSRTSSVRPRATRSTASALIGLAVLLFAFTIVVNMLARWYAGRRRSAGGRMTATRPRRRRADAGRARDWIGAAPDVDRAGASRTRSRSLWMIGSVLVALVPLGFIAFYVVAKGISRHQLVVPHQGPADHLEPARRRHLARDRRDARCSPASPPRWRSRSGCSPRSTSTSTAARADRARDPLHGRRDDRRAVDRDGAVRRAIWVSAGLHMGFSTFAGALALGVPHAADRDPLERRDAEARARRPPPGERRARRAPLAHDRVRVVLPAALPGIVSGAMLAVARAAGETAPLLFTIGITTRVQPEPRSAARTPRSRRRSGTTRSSRSRRRRTARGARRSR